MDADIVTKAVSAGLVAIAYPDLLKPSFQQAGSVMGRVVRAALGPVRGMLWSVEQMESWLIPRLEERLKGVAPGKIVFPEPTVVAPALMALSYSMGQETLREMYAKLLAMAMDSATAKGVHPSFVEVIKQLTPDEARILDILKGDEVLFYDLYAFTPTTKASVSDVVGVTDLFERAECQDLARTDVAVSNLQRQELALFEPRAGNMHVLGEPYLTNLDDVPVLRPHIERIRQSGGTPTASVRAFRLTAFGRSFCSCCIESL